MPQPVSCRVDVFDPKGEIEPFLVNDTEARVYSWSDPAEAARAAVDSGENGILVIEELMVVRPASYADLTEACAIRRRSTDGEGIAIFGTTQRPKIMPVAMRSIADMWLCGQLTDSDDLKAIEKVAGAEYSDLLPSLHVGQFVPYTFGKDVTL